MAFERIAGALRNVGNTFLGRTGSPSPYLLPEEQAAALDQRRMAMAASLLQSAAPTPQGMGPGVFGALGGALRAGQQAQAGSVEDAIRMRMLRAQMSQAQDPSDIRTMQALGYQLTPEGFKAFNAAQARPGTTINVGDALGKMIPPDQLPNVRLPNGQGMPIGSSWEDARQAGATFLSNAESQRATQSDQALGILDQLEELAIGQDGIFREVQPGLANRAASAITFGLDMLSQNDPRAAQFYDKSQATVAPFIKFLGETGSLAVNDVERAIGLLPRMFPLPDTEEVAKRKIAELKQIITRGVNTKPGTYSASRQQTQQQVPPPPAGFTLDPEQP